MLYLILVKPTVAHKVTGAATAAQDNTRAFGLPALKAAVALQAVLLHRAAHLARRLRVLLAAHHRLALAALQVVPAEAAMAYKLGIAARFIQVANKRSKTA